MPVNPFSLSNVCLLLISTGLVAYLFFLWKVIKQKTPPDKLPAVKKPLLRFIRIYAGFIVLLCVVASTRFFNVVTTPPRGLFIFLPLIVLGILLVRAKKDKSLQLLSFLPPALLIVIQSFRVLIELLFVQFAQERLIPLQLSIHGRNYDLLIGLLALPVGFLFFKKYPFAKKAGIAFNVLGLLSLINIFSLVIFSLPSSFRRYNTFYLPTYFPGVFIVFVASLAFYFHVLSLRQLTATGRKTSLLSVEFQLTQKEMKTEQSLHV